MSLSICSGRFLLYGEELMHNGYYTDRERPVRVALSTYLTYFAQSDLLRFIELLRESSDPYAFISQRGVSGTDAPTPEPEP